MPITNFQMDDESDAGGIDFQDAVENGLPALTDDPGANVEVVGQPSAPTGTARDIPHIEIDGQFDPAAAAGLDLDGSSSNPAIDDLRAEIQELKSERGRYGREVVGPLRAENDELKEQLARYDERFKALETGQQQAAQAPKQVTPQDVAVALYGDDVDLEDPTVIREAKAHLATMQLMEGTVAQAMNALREDIGGIRQEVGNMGVYTQPGAPTREQVQNAIKANPELADLPVEKVVSFVARNLNASRGGSAQPTRTTGAVPAYANPNLVVDGGSNVFGNPAEQQSNDEKLTNNLLAIRNKVGFGVGVPSVADLQAAELNKVFG